MGGFIISIKRKRLVPLIIVIALMCMAFYPIQVYAADKVNKVVVGKPYRASKNKREQYRIVKVYCVPKWTKYRMLYQASGWEWLKKGEALWYTDTGGSNINSGVSISVGYGIGSISVSFAVSLGKASSSKIGGFSKVAEKKGYYKIKRKKLIKPTITVQQFRKWNRKNNRWGSWKKFK